MPLYTGSVSPLLRLVSVPIYSFNEQGALADGSYVDMRFCLHWQRIT